MKQAVTVSLGLALAMGAGHTAGHGAFSNTIRLANNARQAGMGGVCRSLADDATAPLCNPAGMAFQEGSAFSADAALVLAHVSYSDPENEPRPGTEGAAGIVGLGDLGFVRRVGDSPLAYGIGYYTYAGGRAKYDINTTLLHPTRVETVDFDVTSSHNRLISAVALQVTDRIAVGGGHVWAYQNTSLGMPDQFSTAVFPPGAAGLNAYIEPDADGWGQGGVFGALVKLGEKTRIGASYTTQMRIRLKGRYEAHLRNNPGLVAFGVADGDRSNFAFAATQKWPQVVSAGISHQVTEQWLVAADWQWVDWSAAADKFEFTLSEGSNATLNGVLGALGSTGEIRETALTDAEDAYVCQVGTEYRPKENWAVRAGYMFSNNPIPEATLQPLGAGIIQHTLALGAGTQVAGWMVDVAWTHAFTNKELVNVSGVEGAEFDLSKIEMGADLFFLSLSRRF